MRISQKQISLESRRIVISIVLTICALPFLFHFHSKADTWIYMTEGRYIFEQKRIPQHKDLSFKEAQPATEWVALNWLSSLLLYFASSAGSTIAVLLVLAPLLIGCIYLLLSITDDSSARAIAVVSVVMLLSLPFWSLHPLVFAPLFSLLIIDAVFAWQRSGKGIHLLPIPIIFMLWANMLGGTLLIPLILTITLLLSVVISIRKRWTLLHSSLILIGSILGSFFNPVGFSVWAYAISSLGLFGANKWFSSLSGTLTAGFSNFTKDTVIIYPFVLLTIIMLAVTVWWIIRVIRYSEVGLLRFLPLFFLFGLGIFWVRFIPLTAFACGMLVLILFRGTKRVHFLRKSIWIWSGICMFALFLLWFSPPSPITITIPKTHLQLIDRYHLPGNIATTPEFSGMTAWYTYPRRGNIDALDRVFDEHETIQVYSLISPVPSQAVIDFFEKNSVHSVLLSTRTEYLLSQLGSDPAWVLIYIDENAALFSQREYFSEDFIKNNTFRYLSLDRSLGFDPEKSAETIKELEKFIALYPENTFLIGQLATVYRISKQPEKAIQLLTSIPENKQSFRIHVETGRALASAHRCLEAEAAYMKALSARDEKNVSRATLDLAVLYAGCLSQKEKATHYFLRYNSYPLPPQERERVRQIAKQFGIAIEEADTDNK